MSKVLEAILLNRFEKIVTNKRLICNEQFCFKQQHSADKQVLRLTEHDKAEFNKNRRTGAVFLDVAKAFDSVWHNGLLRKLIKYKIPGSYIHFLNSYLKSRKFVVLVDNELSEVFNIESGVPQGRSKR